jgi:competence protein ComEC
LRSTGAVALTLYKGRVTMQTARQKAGTRLWTAWPKDRPPR